MTVLDTAPFSFFLGWLSESFYLQFDVYRTQPILRQRAAYEECSDLAE
jgi:hypothetical protein